MISPGDILDMNVARYRGLIEVERNLELRTKLGEALARDLVRPANDILAD